jgi:integrase
VSDRTPLRIEEIRLDAGDRFPLTVDADGMPSWWPNLYCSIALWTGGMGLSTMQSRLNAVCLFHNLCDGMGIDIDTRIESLDLFTAEELASLRDELRISLCKSSRNEANSGDDVVVKNAHWKNRLIAICDYIVWRADPVIDRMSLRDERLPEARRRLAALPGKLVGSIRTGRNTAHEGMDEEAQKAFLNAITPGHPTNPFNKRNQIRNHALWMLYWDGGVRRSEAIVLACRNLHLNGNDPYVFVPRVQDDPADTRKQEPRTKTLAHRVTLPLETAKILSDYVINDRRTYRGAKKSKYVFISQKGRPLSIGAVVAMYERLRSRVAGLPEDFTTHMVRRTHKDRMGDAAEEIGISPETEQQVINAESGWTPQSQTSFRYQRRRLRRKANQIGVKMQDQTAKVLRNG